MLKEYNLPPVRKFFLMLVYLFAYSGIIWAIGLIQTDSLFLKFLIFVGQLLHGGICFEVITKLKSIPAKDEIWKRFFVHFRRGLLGFVLALTFLVLAAKMFLFTYLGVVLGVISYGIGIYSLIYKPISEYKEYCGKTKVE